MQVIIPLTEMKRNQGGIVIELQGGRGMAARLNSMGLRPGVEVTKKTGQPLHGPVTLRFGGTELALGHGIARRILVEAQE
jgi:ferrous iron transport protein A